MVKKSKKSKPVSWRTLLRRAKRPDISDEVAASLRQQAAGLRRGTRGTTKAAKPGKLKLAKPVPKAVSKPSRRLMARRKKPDGDGQLSPLDQLLVGEFMAAIDILRPEHVPGEAVSVPWSQIEALVSAITALRRVS